MFVSGSEDAGRHHVEEQETATACSIFPLFFFKYTYYVL